MSELLTVRDNKDIIGLFQLYQQHLGNAPLEELGEDLASATELLRHQADQLRVELANYEPEAPSDYYLYELFARYSGKTLANKIRHHVRELDDIIAGQNLLLDQMTSIKNVKPILEVRQAQHYFGDLNDYL